MIVRVEDFSQERTMRYRQLNFTMLLSLVMMPITTTLLGGSVEVWHPLFNGKDLTGWTTTGNWRATTDGVLVIQPRPGEMGWQRYADYLWTKKEYHDYVLRLEYKIPSEGNSGIFIGVKNKQNPVYEGIEIQILDSHGKKEALTPHDCGGVIGIQPPKINAARPAGEWNNIQITCQGNHLLVVLNGQQIVDLNVKQKIGRKHPLAGYIGLQDHGLPLEFRNVEIRNL